MTTIDIRMMVRVSGPISDHDDPIADDAFEAFVLALRQHALTQSDWRMHDDAPGDKAAWLAYRAELRDGPAILATRDGDLVTLPDPPEEA